MDDRNTMTAPPPVVYNYPSVHYSHNANAVPERFVDAAPSSGLGKLAVAERNYEPGEMCRFEEAMPKELVGRVEPELWKATIRYINDLYIEAEQITLPSIVDTLLATLTCCISSVVIPSHYSKCMKKLQAYINSENHRVYEPRGLVLKNPEETGRLALEIYSLNSLRVSEIH